ncbi:transglycosylase SLT domain-containing protein [Novosphingobium humi]|uniref:Transglycosylase SLT domain-containing protein n=1 Tax=Novosphingobium humi TaxID=2282397 RepID=A0ABY7U1B2_9SPHN|nr:transglycosylase SLT domain-containing protein [Novosphingobium humi]WCT78672.1 transglycosylase SLT domain-containing protein [Novosphingobium humi]
MSDEAKIGVAIEAENRTDPGSKAAEKRLSQVTKNAAKQSKRLSDEIRRNNRQAANDDEAIVNRRKRSLFSYAKAAHQAFSQMEQSAARTLGTRSVSGGLGGILSQGGNALGIFRSAMTGAATEAGGFELALGGVAGGVGMVAGALVAGTIASQKFGASWADNTAKISRFAKIWGVNAQTLQAFEAGAQRSGAEKGAGSQAIAGIEQSLNGALYGSNPGGYDVMRRLGLAIPRKKDGSLDLNEKFLGRLADAISKRNPEGQRRIANELGIPLEVLPFLTQGGKALQADLAKSQRFSNVQSAASLADAERIQSKNATLGQVVDRNKSVLGHKAATMTEGVLDKEIAAAQIFSDAVGGNFKSSIGILKQAGETFSQAVDTFMLTSNPLLYAAIKGTQGAVHSGTAAGGVLSRTWNQAQKLGSSLYERIEHLGENSRQDQVSSKGAVGVAQIMPSTAQQVARENNIPWDEKRFRNDAAYNRRLGKLYADQLFKRYNGNEVLTVAAYNAGPGRVEAWRHRFGDPNKGQISNEDFAGSIPFKETRNYVGRVADPSKVHVTVEMKGAPPGTKVTARSTGGAVSTAMAN